MKKILASIAALAMAATMATSAFAATTLTGYEEYAGDWGQTQYVADDGTLLKFIDNALLEEYLDTGVTVTVDFEYRTLPPDNKYYDYYLFGICNAGDWSKMAATDASYIAGVPGELDGRVSAGGDAKTYSDGSPVCKYFFQGDGFMVLNKDAAGEWTNTTIKFTVTPEGLQHLIDVQGTNEDGSTWGGILFQIYGVDVKSVTLDAATDIGDFAYNPDPDAGSEDTGSDDNVATGAEAGLALAGIALAAAAVVATKKNK